MKHPLIEPLESRIAPASTLSITSAVTLKEGNAGETAFVFTVTLSEAPTATVSVDYATADVTATAGSDYTARSGTLNFQPGGALTRTISVPVTGDTVGEDDETFTVTLSGATTGTTITNAVGIGTIENDAVLTLSKSGDVVEGDTGTQDITFTVTLSEGPATQTVTANYNVLDVSTNSQDIASPRQGAISFAPGTTSATIVVAVRGDTTQELDESFDLQLIQVVGASVANNNLRATILTDLLTITPVQTTLLEGASGQSLAAFTVDLGDYADTFPVTVSYTTRTGGADGTATAGVDFATTTGTLTFNDATPQTFSVPIYGDTVAEASETFTVNARFLNPGGSVPNFSRDITATIVNDDVSFRIADNVETLSVTQGLAESNPTMNFVVTMTGAITAPVTIDYRTVDGTGTRGATVADGDYVAKTGTLTFTPGGPSTQTIAVTILGDSKVELSESFTVEILNAIAPGFTTAITDNSGLGIIKNDDVSVSIASLGPVAEGQSGTTAMGFRATLTAALPEATTFSYSTRDGTNDATNRPLPSGTTAAIASTDDYIAVTDGTFTIPVGATFVDFFVTVRGDTTIESDEVFTVSLAGNQRDTLIGTQHVFGIIRNDDPFLSIGDVTVSEGTGGTATATFIVTLSQATTGTDTVTVKYNTANGTATGDGPNADFTPRTNQTLTFAAGETQKTITIDIVGDNRFEGTSENFTVVLSDPNLVKVGSSNTPLTLARAAGTATILDDDAPTVSIVPAVRIEENRGAAVFAVSLSNPSDVPVLVDFRTQDGTATVANSDYTARPLTTLTFAAGVSTETVSIAITGDTVNEPDETFQVLLSNARIAGGTTLTLGNATGTGTIANDDRTVTIGNATLTEANAPMNFTVTLSAASTNPVTVFFTTRQTTGANPATSDADFTATTGSIVIPANSTTGTIAIPIRQDLIDEVDQTFEVVLTSVTNAGVAGNGVGTGTILDDDAPPTVQIVPAVSVTEGTGANDPSAVFTVTLSQPSEKAVSVSYATAAGTATVGTDFTAASGTVNIPAGQSSATFSVVVKADAIAEPNETFTATISAPTNATLGAQTTSTATIVNDDTAPTLSIGDVSGRENAGTFTFTVTLSRAYSLPVTVQFTTLDSTATVGSDYTLTAGTLTFAANMTSQTITVPILNNDATPELDERFLVRLSNPTNATLLDGEAIGFIQNDDVAFTVQDLTTAESGNALVTVTRTGTAAATVQFRTVDGTAVSTGGRDFTATSGTLSFAAGELSKTISIPIAADTAYENNEQFTVELFSPVDSVIADATGTVTITDNDAAPTLSVASASRGEASGAIIFTVRLSAANEREDVTVQFETIDGTAISTGANGDFTAPSNGVGEVRFARGETSRTISIPITNDTRDEADETFTLRLRNANAAFTAGGTTLDVTGTILDDDATPTVSLAGGLTIGESESGLAGRVFTANLSAPSDRTVTVNWSTLASASGVLATAGADYTAVSGATLTFAPGVTSQTFTVAILDDALDEADEVFDVQLANPTNATLGTTTRATATITDNDAAPVLTIGDSSLVEGAAPAMFFTVSLSAPSGREITVSYSTTDGTATSVEPFADFTAVTATTLTFAAGETSKTISIPIIDDIYLEKVAVPTADGRNFTLEDERFTVTLASPTNATIARGTATGLILNGGDTVLGIAISNGVASEGNLNANGTAGQNPMTFEVKLSAPATEDVSFSAFSRNGTALAGLDYAAISGTVSIGGPSSTTDDNGVTTTVAGGTTTTLTVNTIGDNLFEGAESFFVDLSDFTGGASPLGADADGIVTRRGTIINDDVQLLDNGRTLQWNDVDGDLVTMTTTRGSFAAVPAATYTDGTRDTNGNLVNKPWLQPISGTVGYGLALLSLLDLGGFAGASISITAEVLPTYPGGPTGDGFVNVGEIRAAQRIGGELDWVGLDLHSVTVDGDLSRIVAGDNISTTALRRLEVGSLGVFGNGPGGSIASEVLGPIGTVLVHGNVVGQLKLIGQEFGRIGTLTIEGGLVGGTADNTGQVLVSGTVGRATIGAIVGGAGANSGALIGNQNNNGSLGDVTVRTAVIGGTGRLSGIILGAQIGDVNIAGLVGNSGENSGLVFATLSNIASFTDTGGIFGGTGASSGQVFAAGSIGHFKTVSVTGNTGANSGSVRANAGAIASVTLTGDLTGGAGDNSGQIFALTTLGPVKIDEVLGGAGDASGSIGITKTSSVDTNNNAIFATTGSIRSVSVNESVVGGDGDFSGIVAAARSLGPVTIGDDLRGGAGGASGQVFSQGTVGRVTIGDDVTGGGGVESGMVKGVRLSEVRIAGDVIGGAGVESGSVEGTSIASLTIGGAIVGAAGNDSGSVRFTDDARRISVGENTAGQSLIGGAGARSGRISITDDLRQIVVAGDLVGGTGNFTGGLVVGGDLFQARIEGSILGGAAPATGAALLNSGFLQASVLHSAVIGGNLVAGADGGAGNANSGVIRTNRLVNLLIEGNVTGTADDPAIISAAAVLASGNLGIENLLIKGNVTFAEILAGYGGDTTASFRGQLTSADAQIGRVEIRGLAAGLNIVAGAAPGADGRFGDATDVLASDVLASVRDSDRVISSIASVILRGGATANAASYGIVAQHVVSVRTGATLTPLAGLTRGAGNDLGATDAADLIVANFRAVEIAV